MNIQLVCEPDGDAVTLDACLHFSLLRERYQPFSVLRARFAVPSAAMTPPQHIALKLDGQTVHAGLVQQAEIRQEGGLTLLDVCAKGYGAALIRNQLEPGNYYQATLQSLLSTYTLPGVTGESGTAAVNYIHVDERQPLWEGVIAYAYKLAYAYPYVRVPNLVCVSPQTSQTAVTISPAAVLASGSGIHTAELISRVDMADLDGQYGTFTLDNPEAAARGIVSVQTMRMDQQFLYSPPDAMQFRISRSGRGLRYDSFTYAGYCGEDIEDAVCCGTLSGRVSRILISGSAAGVVTEDRIYYDDFCNVQA